MDTITMNLSEAIPADISDRLFDLQQDRGVPAELLLVRPRISPDGDVRCGSRRGCEGRLGTIMGVRLDPGPGWEYHGWDPDSLNDRGAMYFGEIGLVRGTWLPRRSPARAWHRARQQASRPSASIELRRRVKEGLRPFARPDLPLGYGWDPIQEDIIAPGGTEIANSAALPLRVVCYVCFAVNVVTG